MTTQRTATQDVIEATTAERDRETTGLESNARGASAEWVHEAWSPPSPHRRTFIPRFTSARAGSILDEDEGAVTAEYAIIIMAAVAFAGLLVAIMRSGEIRGMLVQLVENALSAAG